MRLTYQIDDFTLEVAVDPSVGFTTGEDTVLATEYNDLALEQAWREAGYTVVDASDAFDFTEVKRDITNILRLILSELTPEKDLSEFTLETYHHYVDDALHYQVIGKTRRLYPNDFGFHEQTLVGFLGQQLQTHLGYMNPVYNAKQWIIVRINRPNTIGFNPIHKDIYELHDGFGNIPRMINVWIPICGVEGRTGLPIAPGSHLISEAEISRTKAGSIIEGQRYSVNCIQQWSDSTKLQTICPKYGEMLVFSSHLVHGLGKNYHEDITRISLEFRLYEQSET